MNDEFRHVARALKIVSFYETLPTGIGMKKMVIMHAAPFHTIDANKHAVDS